MSTNSFLKTIRAVNNDDLNSGYNTIRIDHYYESFNIDIKNNEENVVLMDIIFDKKVIIDDIILNLIGFRKKGKIDKRKFIEQILTKKPKIKFVKTNDYYILSDEKFEKFLKKIKTEEAKKIYEKFYLFRMIYSRFLEKRKKEKLFVEERFKKLMIKNLEKDNICKNS